MQKLTRFIGGYSLTLLLPDREPDGAVYLPMHGSPEGIWELLPQKTAALISIDGFDWNRDLSPWPAPAAFGGEDFGGQADAFLARLTDDIIPFAEREAGLTPAWRGLSGYSLAGLFSVYAAYRTDLFSRVASVSGSMWYDGWMDYARRTPLAAPLRRTYFSVGAKEKKTRNVRMACVEENTRQMHGLLLSLGIGSRFHLNPGNHFVDADKRMAAAVGYLTGV